MKKILALVLTVVMAASLAACGNSGTKETQAPASGDSETALSQQQQNLQVRQQRRLAKV